MKWNVKSLKQKIAMVMAVMLVIGVTACAPKTTPTQGGSETAQAEKSAGGEKTTINLWFWDKEIETQYKEMIALFEEKNPNIHVEYSITPWADYWTKMQTALPTGVGPDVFWLNHPNALSYMPTGEILDIQAEVDAKTIDLSHFDEALYTPYQMDGKTYGVPIFFDTIATFYNKRLFDEAGVPYPEDGWTWDDYLAAAQQLTIRDGEETTQYGCIVGFDGQSFTGPFLLQNGGKLYSDDRMASVLDSPENRESVQFMLDLAYKHKVSPTAAEVKELSNNGELFINSMAAIQINGLWMVKPFYDGLGEDLAIAPLPMKKQKASIVHNLAYCGSAKTKSPDAVKTFLQFTTTKEHGDIIAKVFIPAFQDSRELWFESYPSLDLKIFGDALEYAYPLQIAAKNSGPAFTVYENEMEKVFTNEEVGDSLAKAQDAINAEINK